MGNFSRDTFDKLKHYVGVRLQQGVPLVDADWNEMEDIRRFELQAFLKRFIFHDNDGFRIVPVTGMLVLTSKKTEIEIDLEKSTAAAALGFDTTNYRAARYAPPAAQLISTRSGPFPEMRDKTFVIKTRDNPNQEWAIETVTFQGDTLSTDEVATAINKAVNVTAHTGDAKDFGIKGGDGTPEGAGRCLVEGWDVLNESTLCYTNQQLYRNDNLADVWGVDRLDELTASTSERTDTVYLDVWEREVNAVDDHNLINSKIGIETCVRIKREWVVRVAKGQTIPPTSEPDHYFYPLAEIKWSVESDTSVARQITDKRRTGLDGDLIINRGALVVDEVNTTRTPEVPYGRDEFWGKWIRVGNMLTNAGNLPEGGGGGWNLENAFGMHVQNDSDYAFFGSQRQEKDRVDAVIAWGDNPVDNVRFLFGGSRQAIPQERMRITGSGNVGIGTGTDAPAAKLHIKGGGDASLTGNGLLMLEHPEGPSVILDSNEILARNKGQPAPLALQATGGKVTIGSRSNSDPGIILEVKGDIQADNAIMDGNVGIGTEDPERKLHIKGNGRILALEGSDHSYIEYYPDGFDKGRKAWIGFGSKDDNRLTIHNEIEKAHIILRLNGGNVGIGTMNPAALLQVGNATCNGKEWAPTSSIEYKQNVASLTLDHALATIAALNPVTFTYKDAADQPRIGFIAEEVPEPVATHDRKSLSMMSIIGTLTKVVQHLQQEVADLRSQLNAQANES